MVAAYGGDELTRVGDRIIYSAQTGTGIVDKTWENSFLPSRLEAREGLWILVEVDVENSTVTIAQDRFAGMPLYLYNDGNDFMASSQIKAIRTALPGKCPVSLPKVAGLLSSLLPAYFGEETLFDEVRILKPGRMYVYTLDTGKTEVTSYLSKGITQPLWARRDIDELNKEARYFRAALTDAVKRHLAGKGKITLALSGGVDSAVLAVAMKDAGIDFEAVTATYPECKGREPDESALAFQVAERLGLKHSFVPIKGDGLLNITDDLIYAHEEPLTTPGLLASWALEKGIRDMGCIDLLTGLAGDTLFGGLPALWLGALLTKKPLTAFKERRMWNDVPLPVLLSASLNFISPQARKLINKTRELRFNKMPWLRMRPVTPHWYSSTAPDYFTFSLHHGTEEILPSVFRWAVQRSQKLRLKMHVPLIDIKLLSSTLQIPASFVLAEGYNKYLARKAYADLLPADVIWNRRKLGFDVPLELWIKGTWKKEMKEVVMDSRHLPRIVDKTWIENDYKQMKPELIWRLYTTARFLEKFG